MDIRIFNRELRFSAVCDRILSLRATEEFAGAGSFTLRVPLAGAARFDTDRILRFPGLDGDFVIHTVRHDSAAGTAVIAGSGVLSMFGRRILTEPLTRSGAAETLLCELAQTWGGAVLPGTLTTEYTGIDAAVNAATGHVPLLTAMDEICAAAGLGMQLRFDADTRGFRFAVRKRRTVPLFLSRSAGNLRGVTRLWDLSRYKNRVIVQGNGGHVVTVDAAGLFDDGVDDAAQALREEWSDATELAMDRYETEEAYREALAARGRRILAQHRPRQSLTVQVSEETARQLSPGDVCPVTDDSFGVQAQALCAARTVTYSGGETSYEVTMHVL